MRIPTKHKHPSSNLTFFKESTTSLSRQSIYQSPDYSYALKLTGLIALSLLGIGVLVTAAFLLYLPMIAIGAVTALTGAVATNHFNQNYKSPAAEDVPECEPGIAFSPL